MKNFILTISSLSIILLSCASSMPEKEVIVSSIAPAAEAEVTAKRTRNDNTKVNISVKHLAEPERLMKNATQYTVWISPVGSKDVQNVGSIKINENLEGRHETTIPYKNFRLFLTPEKNQMASRPTGPIVFDKIIER